MSNIENCTVLGIVTSAILADYNTWCDGTFNYIKVNFVIYIAIVPVYLQSVFRSALC